MGDLRKENILKNIKNRKIRMAVCYDFDKTLSPNDMQSFTLIPSLEMDVSKFWKQSNDLACSNLMDNNLDWMFQLITLSKAKRKSIKREYFNNVGQSVPLYHGVVEWFARINKYAAKKGIEVEHYIISSGLKEIIEGSKIASEFKRIYASSYLYSTDGIAEWPAQVINYTNKTQYIFRIAKGFFEEYDERVNDSMKDEDLHIPYENFVYIGDSATDIPCMKLVNTYGGHSIGVFNPETQDKSKVYTMMAQNRIKYFAEAIYSKDSNLEKLLKMIIDKTAVTEVLEKRHFECNAEAESYPTNCRKDVLINDLEDSMNFLNIRNTINELRKMGVFTVAQNLKILNAAIQNPQIRSIFEEKEVKEFYSKILKNTDPESDVSKKVKELFA